VATRMVTYSSSLIFSGEPTEFNWSFSVVERSKGQIKTAYTGHRRSLDLHVGLVSDTAFPHPMSTDAIRFSTRESTAS
jgi:hypothetical protein